ncbi:MAG: hypothetical protein SGPRY_001751 [Prymnesium sp.]
MGGVVGVCNQLWAQVAKVEEVEMEATQVLEEDEAELWEGKAMAALEVIVEVVDCSQHEVQGAEAMAAPQEEKVELRVAAMGVLEVVEGRGWEVDIQQLVLEATVLVATKVGKLAAEWVVGATEVGSVEIVVVVAPAVRKAAEADTQQPGPEAMEEVERWEEVEAEMAAALVAEEVEACILQWVLVAKEVAAVQEEMVAELEAV